mmetsp:Transcript_21723/g.49381  ORF Transcript_21723/g.49381 Transcript_21723/m.49381 type:complete len:210 (+) Transcript_21723:676-1305(+)
MRASMIAAPSSRRTPTVSTRAQRQDGRLRRQRLRMVAALALLLLLRLIHPQACQQLGPRHIEGGPLHPHLPAVEEVAVAFGPFGAEEAFVFPVRREDGTSCDHGCRLDISRAVHIGAEQGDAATVQTGDEDPPQVSPCQAVVDTGGEVGVELWSRKEYTCKGDSIAEAESTVLQYAIIMVSFILIFLIAILAFDTGQKKTDGPKIDSTV